MAITATWKHDAGYYFNIVYRTRGGFLRAVSKSKHCRLDHAVDDVKACVIRPTNIEAYKKGIRV